MEDKTTQVYDEIVAKGLQLIHQKVIDKDKIVLSYNGDISSKFCLQLCLFWVSLLDKPLYLETDFLNYIKLKITRNFKVLRITDSSYAIKPSKITTAACQEITDENVDLLIKTLYDLYYKTNLFKAKIKYLTKKKGK